MANFKGLTQCTKSQYNSITKDANTLYCLTDAKILYAPAYSASDAGKMLRVKADGTLEWWREARLPNEYQEVEWIDNRVAGNYIDTGYICSSNNLRVKSKVMFTGSSVTTQSLWGSRNGGTCYTIIPYNTDRMYVGSSDDIANFGTRELNTEYVYDLTANNGSFSGTRNDVSISASYNATMDTTYSQYIFGINYNGTGLSESTYYRLYYWQLWDNNVLACDLVPCYRKSDGVIGVYDLVRSTFCQITGSYPPMKGPDVPPTVVPQTYIGGIPVAIDGGYMLDDYGPLAIDVVSNDYFIAICQGTANKSISWYVGPDKIGGMHQWSSAASRDSGLTSDDYWSESGSRTLPASSIGNLNYFAFNFNKQYASVSYVVDEDGNYLLKGSDVQ